MKIGIIGSDERAVALGRLLRTGGHDVTVGDPSTEQAQRAAGQLGARVERPYRQAMCSDVLFLEVPPERRDAALRAMGPETSAVVVDVAQRDRAERLAHKLNTHSLVRAELDIAHAGRRAELFGDDPHAKRIVSRALTESGCTAVDRGPLANAGHVSAANAA